MCFQEKREFPFYSTETGGGGEQNRCMRCGVTILLQI